MTDILLLPGPLLRPTSWAPVAERLGAAHSNAGLHAPLLSERIDAVGTVWVAAPTRGDG